MQLTHTNTRTRTDGQTGRHMHAELSVDTKVREKIATLQKVATAAVPLTVMPTHTYSHSHYSNSFMYTHTHTLIYNSYV